MRVGIDAIHLSNRGKGISRFEHCFLQALADFETKYEYVIFLNSRTEHSSLPRSARFTYITAPLINLLTWELIQLPYLAGQRGVVLAQTMSDRLPIVGHTRFLMYLSEVPDHRMRAARARSGLYQLASDLLTRAIFPHSLRNAVYVVVPSQATRRELLSRYHVSEAKVRVVSEAAGSQFIPQSNPLFLQRIRERYGAPDGYVLHIASANDPRDNTAVVLRAIARAVTRLGYAKKLVIVGNTDLKSTGLNDLLIRLGLANQVILTGFVPDQELVQLYQAADAYIDSSLYEGFGLQVLEAMACGVPVICSKVSSLPEIAGDAAIMLQPMDDEGFGDALVQVLSDAQKAAQMRILGLERVKHFSWQKTVKELVELYDEALS